jgi:hypothetical protein
MLYGLSQIPDRRAFIINKGPFLLAQPQVNLRQCGAPRVAITQLARRTRILARSDKNEFVTHGRVSPRRGWYPLTPYQYPYLCASVPNFGLAAKLRAD